MPGKKTKREFSVCSRSIAPKETSSELLSEINPIGILADSGLMNHKAKVALLVISVLFSINLFAQAGINQDPDPQGKGEKPMK